MKYFVRIVLAATLALNLSCKGKENVLPTCEILTPADGDYNDKNQGLSVRCVKDVI
jgi:hypothetical protein